MREKGDNVLELKGLIAASFTPLKKDGSLNLKEIPKIVDDQLKNGIKGFYVLGSTGEGFSLTVEDRKRVAEAYVEAVDCRVPVVVQVGHNSIDESVALAKHAGGIADAISSNAPSYFKVSDIDLLIECMFKITDAAPDVPFYYYHIPFLTGADLDMVEFLRKASRKIPSLRGIKFSENDLKKYKECKDYNEGEFDIVWGIDELLLDALESGAKGAVGSTYNMMPRLYHKIIKNYEQKNMEGAKSHMKLAESIIDVFLDKYAPLHPSLKSTMRSLGYEVGYHKLPLPPTIAEVDGNIRKNLEELDFYNWSI